MIPNQKLQIRREILYSFRRCPYAIRTRMALLYSRIIVEIREVELKNKPDSLLAFSPKGSVPVLVLTSGQVIEESREVIHWALSKHDPDGWKVAEPDLLVDENDHDFKHHLDHYKYADRYPQQSEETYRDQCEIFLQKLEQRLSTNSFLSADKLTETDILIFPFIRQFAFVDKAWFDQTKYSQLQLWLDSILQSDLFKQAMKKYPPWKREDPIRFFPE